MAFHRIHFSFVEKVSKFCVPSHSETVITAHSTMLVACPLPLDFSSTFLSLKPFEYVSLLDSNANPNSTFVPSVSSIPTIVVNISKESHKPSISLGNELVILFEAFSLLLILHIPLLMTWNSLLICKLSPLILTWFQILIQWLQDQIWVLSSEKNFQQSHLLV